MSKNAVGWTGRKEEEGKGVGWVIRKALGRRKGGKERKRKVLAQ